MASQPGDSYDTHFYRAIGRQSRVAAERVLPIVRDLVAPSSVLDVGCGTGEWLRVWRDLGVDDVVGVDGAHVPLDSLAIPYERFVPADLHTGEFALGRCFDLAMCLEVAEHLPEPAAGTFVASLAAHAPVVLFSAAIPGQGGVAHVNERWPSYWGTLFQTAGFALCDVIRPAIWDDGSLPAWYRQNMLLFVHGDAQARLHALAALPSFHGAPLVHPDLFATRRRRVRDVAAEMFKNARAALGRSRRRRTGEQPR